MQQVGVFSKLLLSVGELKYTLTLLFPFFPFQLGEEKRAKAFVESLYGKDEGSSYISRIEFQTGVGMYCVVKRYKTLSNCTLKEYESCSILRHITKN